MVDSTFDVNFSDDEGEKTQHFKGAACYAPLNSLRERLRWGEDAPNIEGQVVPISIVAYPSRVGRVSEEHQIKFFNYLLNKGGFSDWIKEGGSKVTKALIDKGFTVGCELPHDIMAVALTALRGGTGEYGVELFCKLLDDGVHPDVAWIMGIGYETTSNTVGGYNWGGHSCFMCTPTREALRKYVHEFPYPSDCDSYIKTVAEKSRGFKGVHKYFKVEGEELLKDFERGMGYKGFLTLVKKCEKEVV